MRWWVVVLAIVLLGLVSNTFVERALVLSVVLAVLFGGIQFVVYRRAVRSAWENNSFVRKAFTGVASEDGVRYELDDGSSSTTYRWQDLLKYRDHDDFVLLYVGPSLSFIVMSRYFAGGEEWNRFRDLVKTCHG
jgi:hypothetical protein